MDVQPDFKELLESFNSLRVEYLSVGGYALAVPPVRIDLITSLSGVSWDAAWTGSVAGEYGEIPVRYIGRDAFLKNKRAAGRQRDLADIEALGER